MITSGPARDSRIDAILRAALPGLVVALPPLYWVIAATKRASYAALGRDQGIFQYIAWAIRHGARDYRDVRDVNGPLTHLVHVVMLMLGGGDEHRFRTIDLTMNAVAFMMVGACLAGIGRETNEERSLLVRISERASWALAAWVVLSGQYLLYIFWDTSQRESFFDWFMLASVALQLAAQTSLRHDGASKHARNLLVIAGALGVLPWFGKATYALFTFAQLAALTIDDLPQNKPFARIKPFLLGVAIGSLVPIAFLIFYADIPAFLRLYFVDVPTLYRFLWPRTISEMFSAQRGHAIQVVLALATSVVMLAMIVEKHLPRRALAIALLPLCGLASVVAQKKGFDYHFHPVTSALAFQWLAIVVWSWERHRSDARLIPFVLSAALTTDVAWTMTGSPHFQCMWLDDRTTASSREDRAYWDAFKFPDFFPWEMREAAKYLRDHTTPDERVQTYGMDPYILFLAERRSATPYIYAYDLNADAELSGGFFASGLHPDDAQAAVIRSARDAHENDMRTRLEADPPAAFVFFDRAPLISRVDAWDDFAEHSPSTAAWVRAHYEESAKFGDVRVWLKSTR